MTPELVARLGSVETRGERPCVPAAVLVVLLQALRGNARATPWSKFKARVRRP